MQRLNLEQGVFRAQITDWRAVVDCILIDTQHDGQVFNVALADVPERKQDFVLVSSFGLWAAILGMGPLFALRALLLP